MCRLSSAAPAAKAELSWSDGVWSPQSSVASSDQAHYSERAIPSRSAPAFQHGLAAKGLENAPVAAGPKAADTTAEVPAEGAEGTDDAGRRLYDQVLRRQLFPSASAKGRLLSYQFQDSDAATAPPTLRGGLGEGRDREKQEPRPRRFPKEPTRVLQANRLLDDFYSNLLDFSSTDTLAVGLYNCVDMWSSRTCSGSRLAELRDTDRVMSVKWSTSVSSTLAIGTRAGEVQIWDASSGRPVRSMFGHRGRVGAMAWHESLLFTGGYDGHILQRDLRAPAHYISRLSGHEQEVCGLSWSSESQQLASGGNDGAVLVWSAQSSTPERRFEGHSAGAKALAWSPHERGVLASGGGSADKCIRTWNTLNGASLSCTDTGSQVCNLFWSEGADELLSSHGYWGNEVALWRRKDMAKVAVLSGHTQRVVHLAVSPDGQTFVTGTGDEMLRFWSMCPGPRLRRGQPRLPTASCLARTIR